MALTDSLNHHLRDEWRLPNGLRIVGERLPYLRTVSVGVWLHVGSMMETPKENGLSHFMEHMVFKGTARRSARQIAEEMDAVGGQLNAFTAKECTCYYAKVIDEDLDLALDILADMTVNASLDENELSKERGVILEEIAMDEDSPEDLVSDLLCATQFRGQSLGMPILGPASQVSAYTRDDLVRYRAGHYCPRDTVVALCGNYEPEKVRALCEKYFGMWHNDLPELVIPAQQALTGLRAKREKDTEQTHVCLGYPCAGYGEERVGYAQAILCNLLGGAMSSRLFQRVREELGMAYTIYSSVSPYQGCGYFSIYAGVNPGNARRVLEEIDRECARLLDRGITDKEFADNKRMMRSSFLMGLESSGARMQSMGRRLLLRGEGTDYESMLASIDAVERGDVMDAARRILTQPPCIAVIGRGMDKLEV